MIINFLCNHGREGIFNKNNLILVTSLIQKSILKAMEGREGEEVNKS